MTINPGGLCELLQYWQSAHISDFGKVPNRLRRPQITDDPDPTILSQLIERGKAEVQR